MGLIVLWDHRPPLGAVLHRAHVRPRRLFSPPLLHPEHVPRPPESTSSTPPLRPHHSTLHTHRACRTMEVMRPSARRSHHAFPPSAPSPRYPRLSSPFRTSSHPRILAPISPRLYIAPQILRRTGRGTGPWTPSSTVTTTRLNSSSSPPPPLPHGSIVISCTERSPSPSPGRSTTLPGPVVGRDSILVWTHDGG